MVRKIQKTEYIESEIDAIKFKQQIQMLGNLMKTDLSISSSLISWTGSTASSASGVINITRIVDISDEVFDNVLAEDMGNTILDSGFPQYYASRDSSELTVFEKVN